MSKWSTTSDNILENLNRKKYDPEQSEGDVPVHFEELSPQKRSKSQMYQWYNYLPFSNNKKLYYM